MSCMVLSAGLLLAGCSTSGYKQADATAVSSHELAENVQMENVRLDSTMISLNDLVNNPANDLRPQFKRYNHALNQLIASADRTEKSADDMQRKGAAYFDTWNRDIAAMQFGVVRESSENRRDAVSNQFYSVTSRYQKNQAVVRPMISYLRDIRTALSADLTRGGLESVRDVVAKANENSRVTRTALTQLSSDLTTSGIRMSSRSLGRNVGAPGDSREEVNGAVAENWK